jgi:2,4-dienoyl-CoA reductase-like NADH-dependent reductase (Old Yellow Enzyme family)
MDAHSMGDSDRLATFTYVARQLGERGIAFICAREHQAEDSIGPQLKSAFGGVYIANEGFTQASAQAALDAGEADAVAWGKHFIANPDLVERFARNAPLNDFNVDTFYSPGAHGYTDYPSLQSEAV